MLIRWCALVLLVAGCGVVPTEEQAPDFVHEIEGQQSPWTHERFDTQPDKFTFAVVADLTGGERERVFDIAVAQLNLSLIHI